MKLGSLLLAACAIMTAQAGNIAQAQTSAFPVVEASIADIEAAYLTGLTTARAVTQAHLDRIAAFDKRGPLINSLITVNPQALADADRLDAALALTGRPVGPLHGSGSIARVRQWNCATSTKWPTIAVSIGNTPSGCCHRATWTPG